MIWRDRGFQMFAYLKSAARSALHHAWLEATLLLFGIVTLRWRYDIHAETGFRAWVVSSLFMLVALPSSQIVLATFGVRRPIRLVVLGLCTALVSFPYRALGLTTWFYELKAPYVRLDQFHPSPALENWLPAGFRTQGIPHERSLFIGVLTIGLSVIALAVSKQGSLRRAAWIAALWVMTVAQSYLHNGLRCSATYVTLKTRNPWVVFAFGDGRGAVNKDAAEWFETDYMLWGYPGRGQTPYLRRGLPAWLMAQFDYFVHTTYPWLVFNILCWFGAAVAAYALARHYRGLVSASVLSLLIATAPAFAAHVAFPGTYVASFALLWLALLLVERREFGTLQGWAALAATLACLSLSYEALPAFLAILLYTWARKGTWHAVRALAALLVALTTYAIVIRTMARVGADTNSAVQGELAEHIIKVFRSVDMPGAYRLVVRWFGRVLVSMLRMYLVVPALLALVAVFVVGRKARIPAVLLCVPAALGVLLLIATGRIEMESQPHRMAWSHPGVFLLIAALWSQARQKWYTAVPAAGALLATLTLHTIDAFGYRELGELYHLNDPTVSLPNFGN